MPSLFRDRFPRPEDLDKALRETIEGVGEDAELIFAAHAPTRTHRLARSVRARWVGSQLVVTASARDPQTGFDYTAVSRFGHRVAFIEPRADRGAATVLATGRARATGGRAALRFVIGGRVFFRRRVKGYKPATDWRDEAMPAVEAVTETAMRTLGQRIVAGRY